MTRTEPLTIPEKSGAVRILDTILLTLCIAVLVLRATLTEGPPAQSSILPMNLSDATYSLAVSVILILSFFLYFAFRICKGKLIYHSTGIEIPLLIFALAALISGLAASNKRLAITYFTVIIAPLLMTILLVQILDSTKKIKLLLAITATLAIVNTYQSADQFFSTNQMTIEQYEKEPYTFLEPLGIEPGTLQHFLFEHRIYSRGVRGYFTTRNSAGSFFLITFFAALALLTEKLKNLKALNISPVSLIAGIAVPIVILFGLVLTKSKGAFIGLFLATLALALYYRFATWLATHKKAILIACLLLMLTTTALIVQYGLTHDTLPGGNSMLVRWQYWRASAQMIADHPLTGVGPGNFANYYTQYKPPAALESVSDPHNFILSILTQFGPLGLLAFMAIFALPLIKVTRHVTTNNTPSNNKTNSKVLLPLILFAASAILFLARPILMPTNIEAGPEIVLYVTFAFYIAPAAVFFIAFFLLIGQPRRKSETPIRILTNKSSDLHFHVPIIFCAVIAFLIHNLIDFAIFEPPVFTTLCTLIACMIAAHINKNKLRPITISQSPVSVITMVALFAITTWLSLAYAFIPTAKSSTKIAQAKQAMYAGHFKLANDFLKNAAKDDPLSPDPYSTNARFCLQNYQWSQSHDQELLLTAERNLLDAEEKDPATYKSYERLTEVYSRLAELSPDQAQSTWLPKAFDAATKAVERYPGCGRLHLDLAQTAEQLGKTDIAMTHYKNTVEIEDAYRAQFKKMYPQKDLVSRLGNDQYNFAKQRIEQLSQTEK